MGKKDNSEALEILKDLEELFDDRIIELNDVKGMQADRHAFILYRNKLWEIINVLNK